MSRLVRAGLVLLLVASMACSTKARLSKLPENEFNHYYALRVWMSEEDQKGWARLKTTEERDAWLKEKGLWDRFYKYDEATRQQIIDGEVKVGWSKDMLLMSWGRPYEEHRLPGRQAERSFSWIYRFEEHPDGSMLVWEKGSKTEYKAVRLFDREVILDDDKVAEIRNKKKG